MKVASLSVVFPRHGQPFPIVPLQHLGVPFRQPQTPPCRWQHPAWARSKTPSLSEQGNAPDVASDVGVAASRSAPATTGCGSAVARARTPVITIASTKRFMASSSLPGVALRRRSRPASEQPECHGTNRGLALSFRAIWSRRPSRKSGTTSIRSGEYPAAPRQHGTHCATTAARTTSGSADSSTHGRPSPYLSRRPCGPRNLMKIALRYDRRGRERQGRALTGAVKAVYLSDPERACWANKWASLSPLGALIACDPA
jgi:hypothetical protein